MGIVSCPECRKQLREHFPYDGHTQYCNELCELQYQQRKEDLRKEILQEVRDGEHPGYYYGGLRKEARSGKPLVMVDILHDKERIKSKL